MADSAHGRPGPLSRAEGLAPLIEASAGEGERARRLAPPLVALLHEAGLYRLLLPRALDGTELDPVSFVRGIEAGSPAGASTAGGLWPAAGCTLLPGHRGA